MTIHTDGGCLGNPGSRRLGLRGRHGRRQVRDAGYAADTTNNRMELQAVIEALKLAQERADGDVTVITDSRYVEGGISEWISRWEANGWKTKSRSPVKNRDLWQELQSLKRALQGRGFRVAFRRVRGHAGVELNEACDRLVTETIAAGRRGRR
ncbi:Ribonuclease H [Geodia barretti]|uniref:ribonuclease H n=1 Tax=Geodia barretti TaxID=519541 RepID=A0AA35RGT0_GEOBA|nr:Ribonuclease H [Geodia barretti]